MTYFQVLFSEKHSDIIEYEGTVYHRFFPVCVNGSVKLKLKFIKSNSPFTQSIVIFFPEGFNGKASVDGKQLVLRKRFPVAVFWEDTSSAEFEVLIRDFCGEIGVCNGADPIGTKTICKHLSGGCAMIVEKITDSYYSFYCHDHTFPGPCDHLIFELEIEKTEDSSAC